MHNIVQINYEASLGTDPKYLEALKRLGINTRVFCKDENGIDDIRLNLFDWNVELIKPTTKNNLDNASEICDNTYYKNSRTILSDGQRYTSKAAWLKNKPEAAEEKIIDCCNVNPHFYQFMC